jgi:gliding motility-associated-like protein
MIDQSRKLFLFILFISLISAASAQIINYPIHVHSGQTIETCSGYFVDSGGDTITPYGPNENYNITFTNDGTLDGADLLKLDFLFFGLGASDTMYIYDGPDDSHPMLVQATGDQLTGEAIYSSGESLHIRFESSTSDLGLGWMAVVECFSLCDLLLLEVNTNTGSFDFCPEVQSVSFSALASYSGREVQNTDLTYSWYFDGTIREGQNVSHNYPGSGAYPFTVTATDQANGCQAAITQTVRFSTIPDFNGTISSVDTVCARIPFTLAGMVQPVTWTGFPTNVDTIAKITEGIVFESQLNFDVFEDDMQITTIQDFDKVCVNIEHVDFGHLHFELECPSGARVLLKETGPGGANLGEPVVDLDDFPGLGYEYCFSASPQFATMGETSFRFHSYLDQAGIGYYFNAPYLPEGNYTPVESFDQLAGCPLNGTWTIRVTDIITGSAGHVFGWSLFFDESFYPDSLIFTPEIISTEWLDSGTPLTGNPVNVTKQEKGEYEFVFRAIDNFGCEWDTTVVVTVLPLPKAEIVSELEIPVCEGDSTIFSVVPLDDSPFHWIYQWMIDNAELEGRTYDTLMAKDPVNYMVWVNDTLTGCFDIFELQLLDQNCDLTIPNVFTPNGDGINDFFEITNLEHYPNSQMVVFNRNGKKVFEHSDYFGNWWDGGNHPVGTYYFVLTYTRQGNRRQTQGVITIIR